MEYLKGFLENLSSKYTSVVIAFLFGYVLTFKMGIRSILVGLFFGLLFATVIALLTTLMEYFFPSSITLVINLNFMVALLILLFFVNLMTKDITLISESDEQFGAFNFQSLLGQKPQNTTTTSLSSLSTSSTHTMSEQLA